MFALGAAKGRVARQPRWPAELQVLLIGGVSAGVGFVVGKLVTSIV